MKYITVKYKNIQQKHSGQCDTRHFNKKAIPLYIHPMLNIYMAGIVGLTISFAQ